MITSFYVLYSLYTLYIIIFFYVVDYIIYIVTKSMVFVGHNGRNSILIDYHKKELLNLMKKNPDNVQKITFFTSDNVKLSGILFNTLRKPLWKDKIILYSYGNTGTLNYMFECESCKALSKYGSIFMYDYREYGHNEGSISEDGCYKDVLGAWNYLTDIKNVSPNDIIIFGHSLGASPSTHLVYNLYQNKRTLPKHLILWAPFTSVKDMANLMIPYLGLLSPIAMDNYEKLKTLNKKINILVLHGEFDTIVPICMSEKMEKTVDLTLIKLNGNHCDFTFTKELIYQFENIFC
jgi:hypothetical protein